MAVSLRCLLLGHDDLMVRTPKRLWLRCDHCGRETQGWTLNPRQTARNVHVARPFIVQTRTGCPQDRRGEPIAA
jgi:hypothetical protein